jgi:transposase InsO family protein
MARSRHTSADLRKAIRESPDSLRVLAARYAINPKTVAKWKKRESADDLPPGPKAARRGRLTAEEEDIVVRFREHTLLPLDDCLYALQAQIPHLSRSALHRCLQRHGISRLADTAGRAPPAGSGASGGSGAAPLGWLHVDRAIVHSADGAHYLFNAIDQSSRFVFVRMGPEGGSAAAADFLAALVARVPFRISQVFTLDTEPFAAGSGGDGDSAFTQACRASGIAHRLTGSPHPWTRGSGARMGRMIEDSLTFSSGAYIADLLRDFVQAYNFRRRLKTLRGQTPYEFICRIAAQRPDLFLRDPHHEMAGLEIVPG